MKILSPPLSESQTNKIKFWNFMKYFQTSYHKHLPFKWMGSKQEDEQDKLA